MMLVMSSFKQSSKSSARASATPLSRANSRNHSERGRSSASWLRNDRLARETPSKSVISIGSGDSGTMASAVGPLVRSDCAPRLFEIVDDRDDLIDLGRLQDRKSTRLNSSHLGISYAVFCLTK